MKKLLVLILIAGLALPVAAQRNMDRRPDYRKGHSSTYRMKDRSEMQRRLMSINRNYDMQVSYVRDNPHLRKREKNKKIRQLEKERKLAVNRCRDAYARGYANDYPSRNKRDRYNERW